PCDAGRPRGRPDPRCEAGHLRGPRPLRTARGPRAHGRSRRRHLRRRPVGSPAVSTPESAPDDLPFPDSAAGAGTQPETVEVADAAMAIATADVDSQAPIGPADVVPGLLDRSAAVRAFDESVDRAFDRLRGN